MSDRPTRSRNPEGRMTLGQHLVELRKRITIAGVAIIIAAIGGWWLVDPIWAALSEPVLRIAEEQDRDASLTYVTVGEAFDTHLIIMFLVGIVVASPVWLYQLWAFIVPALHKNEKGYAVGFLVAGAPLFISGCVAAWLVFPNIVTLLTGFAFSDSATLLQARIYLDFAVKFILAIGVGFVLPLLLVLLNFARVVSAQAMLKAWRWAILAIATFTALATPAADVLSMVLLAIPLVGLYFAACAVAAFNDRRIARKEATLADEYGLASSDD
ncbi:twin-arginine translocase subunit TatC [Microcella alkaliphila]|uniref:Sec-independent protein translocase protein TatC n=1 Tax=Microcella alkaliphila TaxID=279828 RepID=A0A0U5BNF9_9MICO|nr:twin-arginine translocase subunit TatC [Microcella alkaliphila]BAU32395.1 Sec-independent protein translocase protein TatC [Microcella alkaliphila]